MLKSCSKIVPHGFMVPEEAGAFVMPRAGFVIETTGDMARVSTSRRGVCDGCGDRSRCAFDQALGQGKPEEIVAKNTVHARPGDLVEFDLVGHTELKVSLLVWVVPLAGLITGAAAGAYYHETLLLDRDLATLLGALAGCALAFLLVFAFERRAKKDPRLTPRILKVVNSSSCPTPREESRGPLP
jgi:sigma-E factor negative regulatory protein RseC